MNRKEFNKWVDKMYEKYWLDSNVQATFFDEEVTTTIVYHFKKRKIGIARCHPDDKFNRETGIAIAYARCKGIEVPKISTYKKFCELKNGDKFKGYLSTYLFIGKCYGHNNEITYAIQNIETLNIKQISTDYYNKEVEMVE